MTKRLAGVVFVMAMAVAACGGSSKPASEPAAAPAPAAAAPAPAPAEAAGAAGDPEGKLTETQCNDALTHAEDLMANDERTKANVQMMKDAHAQLVAQCLEKGNQKDYDCLMAAKTFDELGKCEQPE
jgi:hypothetical protein